MANSYGTATALTGNANSKANGTYTLLQTIDLGVAPPHEVWIKFSNQASAATSGNQQAVYFVADSLDNTTFSDTPSSTTEANANWLGRLSLPDTSAHVSPSFPVSPLFGGALPRYISVYVKNDCGVAFAATGQTAQYQTETFG